jgi:hypothetical protein
MPRFHTKRWTVVLALGLFASTGRPGVATAQVPHPTPVVNSSAVPADVMIPTGSSGNPIAAFDDYSWRAFLAMVWPAKPAVRGVPDTTKTVNDLVIPRVFETYKSVTEVFHPDGSPPTPWDQFDLPKYNPCSLQMAWGDLTLGSFNKFGDANLAGFGNLVGPLIAQNTTYTRYLTAYNQIEFNNILKNQWFLQSKLPAPPAAITFDDGALDVKSAWVDMTGNPHPERFYTRTANLLDTVTGVCKPTLVGLVGLHIVQKTPTRPQWIWSTFEHIDNVPPGAPGAPGNFTYHDGRATPMPNSPPYSSTRPLTAPVPPPFNVQRLTPINGSTIKTNTDYHTALPSTSVWQFYQLVMTQWPVPGSTPGNDGSAGNSFPGTTSATTAFANPVLETFDQRFIFSGCMNCHNQTRTKSDFVWSVNLHAFNDVGATAAELERRPSRKALRGILEGVIDANEQAVPQRKP